jgi:DNA-binding transcriptional LysR family regulator/transcription elongation GreA/GreB family factor
MRATPDDILGMAVFARVVEARSFSDAARALGLSKSAVSARVARLEERLGVRLLHRTTRRLALTADGVRLYERCARMVTEAEGAAELAAGASDVPRGTLRVHLPAGFGPGTIERLVGDFMKAHPEIRLELRFSEHLPELGADPIDVAVVIAKRLVDSGLTTRRLASVRMVACAAPSYLRRRGIPFRPQDLVLHDCVAQVLRADVDELSFQTNEGPVSMARLSKLVADDARFVKEAALEGLGVAMLPGLLVADDLAAGRLHRVLDEYHAIELGIHALHPHGRLAPASVRVFVEHLAARLRDLPEAPPPRSPSRRSRGHAFPMTDQDIRRLGAVAALYADVAPEDAAGLEALVACARPTPAAKIPAATVTMNSRLRVVDEDDGEREISLVYPWDASGRDRVAVTSVVGRGLLGSRVGARIDEGARASTIARILYQPEAAGDHHL